MLPSWHDLQELYHDSTANGFAAFSSKGKGIDLEDQSNNHIADAINLSDEHDQTDTGPLDSQFITNLDDDDISPTQTSDATLSQGQRNGKRSKSLPSKQNAKVQRLPIDHAVATMDKLA